MTSHTLVENHLLKYNNFLDNNRTWGLSDAEPDLIQRNYTLNIYTQNTDAKKWGGK